MGVHVFLTHGLLPSALAAARCLTAHGHRVTVGVDFLVDNVGAARVVKCNPRMVLGVTNAVDAGVPIPARVAELGCRRHDTVAAARPSPRRSSTC